MTQEQIQTATNDYKLLQEPTVEEIEAALESVQSNYSYNFDAFEYHNPDEAKTIRKILTQALALPKGINKVVDVSVVYGKNGVRCVYMDDHRICGGKPYVSEGLSRRDFKIKASEIYNALGLKAMIAVAVANEERNSEGEK